MFADSGTNTKKDKKKKFVSKQKNLKMHKICETVQEKLITFRG